MTEDITEVHPLDLRAPERTGGGMSVFAVVWWPPITGGQREDTVYAIAKTAVDAVAVVVDNARFVKSVVWLGPAVFAAQPTAPEAVKLSADVIADAVQPNSIFCFEDGKRYKSMKRTLVKFGLTPAEYRAKWGLPPDFPMVAPSYSARRSALAKASGLGRK